MRKTISGMELEKLQEEHHHIQAMKGYNLGVIFIVGIMLFFSYLAYNNYNSSDYVKCIKACNNMEQPSYNLFNSAEGNNFDLANLKTAEKECINQCSVVR
jgi:hypothetical protein